MHNFVTRLGKQKKIRIWKDYQPSAPSVTIEHKEFTGKVLVKHEINSLS